MGTHFSEDQCLYGIGVHPDYQGKQIADALMRQYLNALQNEKISLSVLSDNIPAMKLYEKYGFKQYDQNSFVHKDLAVDL